MRFTVVGSKMGEMDEPVYVVREQTGELTEVGLLRVHDQGQDDSDDEDSGAEEYTPQRWIIGTWEGQPPLSASTTRVLKDVPAKLSHFRWKSGAMDEAREEYHEYEEPKGAQSLQLTRCGEFVAETDGTGSRYMRTPDTEWWFEKSKIFVKRKQAGGGWGEWEFYGKDLNKRWRDDWE